MERAVIEHRRHSLTKDALLGSYCYYNKLPQTWWVKVTYIYIISQFQRSEV